MHKIALILVAIIGKILIWYKTSYLIAHLSVQVVHLEMRLLKMQTSTIRTRDTSTLRLLMFVSIPHIVLLFRLLELLSISLFQMDTIL